MYFIAFNLNLIWGFSRSYTQKEIQKDSNIFPQNCRVNKR